MNTMKMRRASILLYVLLMCLAANIIIAGDDNQKIEGDYLSVRESLLPMFSFTFQAGNEFFPIYRINPQVREYIRFYLEKDRSLEYAAGAVWLLGFVGTKDDIEVVDNYIQSYLNSANENHRRFIRAYVAGSLGCFAGTMIRRGVEGAEEFCKRYANVSSWMSPVADDNYGQIRSAYNYFIYGAYNYSKADWLLSLLKQATSGGGRPFLSDVRPIENRDKYTEMMKPPTKSEEELKKLREDFLSKNGELIDVLLRKQTLAEWREARKRAVLTEEKQAVDAFESVDLSGRLEGGYLQSMAREAVRAYEQISRLLLYSDVNDLPISKEILKDIENAGLHKYEGFEVMIDVEAHIDNIAPTIKRRLGTAEGSAGGPVVIREKQTAAVTFQIRGSADVLRKYSRNSFDRSFVSPRTGDLIVKMERNSDRWQWSPIAEPNVSADSCIADDKYLIDSVNNAIIAYTQITQSLVKGSYDPLTIPILDNGKVIPLERRQKGKDKMVKDLAIEKKILEELQKAKLNNYSDYHVKVRFEATLSDVGLGDKLHAIKGYETADVSFVIPGAAEIFRKHAPRGSGHDTFSGGDGLLVRMKRINGKWYWNPFGW